MDHHIHGMEISVHYTLGVVGCHSLGELPEDVPAFHLGELLLEVLSHGVQVISNYEVGD